NLAVQETRTLTVTARVTATKSYANTVRISGDQFDPVSQNNSATVTPVPQLASLRVSKQADLLQIDSPGDVTYTITVENDGTTAIPRADLTLTDRLTIDARIVTLTPTYVEGDLDGNDILDPGETWSYSALYSVTQADIEAGADL